MIYNFPYKKSGNVQLWINETPRSRVNPESIICGEKQSNCRSSNYISNLAIELKLNMHCSNYGLLGFEFTPHDNNSIIIEVHSDNSTDLYEDTISFYKDTVYIGLRSEYTHAILEKALECIDNISGLPSGKYVFNIGACCEVGSSIGLFRIITEMLMIFMVRNQIDYNAHEVEEILKPLLVFS